LTPEKLKILFLHNPADSKADIEALGNYELKLAENKPVFQSALKDFSPDIIISDNTAACNSTEALQAVKADRMKIPFIVIAASLSVPFVLEVMKGGAVDCLEKGNAGNLLNAVQHARDKYNAEKAYQVRLEKKVMFQAEQLRQSDKDLESLQRSLSSDLRSPLQVISNYVFILGKKYIDRADYDAQLILTSIKSNIKQMGQLMNDLVSLSKIGFTQIEKEEVNMNEVVKEAVNEINMTTKNKGIKIIINNLPPAFGHRALIKRVWINLIINAYKYTASELVPEIEIGSEQKDGKTNYYIRSNGAGPEQQNAETLFNVFQPLHKSTELEQTAVGLAEIHRIITRHEGNIWTASPKSGSLFYFNMPAN
jgi:K+-sensing histidine kinase KdpD